MFVRNNRGFTLLEALLVVFILGMIAALIVPRFLFAKESAAEKTCKNNIATLNTQVEKYQHDTGEWPDSIQNLIDGYDPDGAGPLSPKLYLPDGMPLCPSGGVYAFDPDGSHRVGCYKPQDGSNPPVADTDSKLHGLLND